MLVLLFVSGYIIPETKQIPVAGADTSAWNKATFWYEPWGSSGTHKGIDIFSKKGVNTLASTAGLVVYTGHLKKGGNVVAILGPKWRIHYYAHLDSTSVAAFSVVRSGQKIGTVGDSGNAKGKQPHIHYSIVSLLPYPWLVTTESQGWKKMFYLDPDKFLT